MQRDLAADRTALSRLSQAAQAAWARIIATGNSNLLSDQWVALVEYYGDLTAALGADVFEVTAADLGVRPRLKMAPAVSPPQAAAKLAWALSTVQRLGNMNLALDELVKQPYRETVQGSAHASGIAWARVPTGAKTCAFCRLLASRGAVYQTRSSASRAESGRAYHGDCDCMVVPVRDKRDYPEGYDPDALGAGYLAARREAGGDLKDILAQMRADQGSN